MDYQLTWKEALRYIADFRRTQKREDGTVPLGSAAQECSKCHHAQIDERYGLHCLNCGCPPEVDEPIDAWAERIATNPQAGQRECRTHKLCVARDGQEYLQGPAKVGVVWTPSKSLLLAKSEGSSRWLFATSLGSYVQIRQDHYFLPDHEYAWDIGYGMVTVAGELVRAKLAERKAQEAEERLARLMNSSRAV